jgi:hypothetical protein
MVDFNNDATVATPATDVIRILILQRRNDCIEAIEAYMRNLGKMGAADPYEVRARIYSLYLELQAALRRRLPEAEYQALRVLVVNHYTAIIDLVRCFEFMNQWLDENKLIRIDTKKQYDSTLVTEEDGEKGL